MIVETNKIIWNLHESQPEAGLNLQDFEEVALEQIRSARIAAEIAYAPYSNFRVGASVLATEEADSRKFTGCNVENASYGATMCAERVAIYSAVAKGYREFRVIALSTLDSNSKEELSQRSPCGLCRQVMSEFFSPYTKILIDGGSHEGKERIDLTAIDTVLPWRFELS